MKTIVFVLLGLVAAGLLWIRLAPLDPDDWHIDPAEAGDPQRGGVRLIGRDAPRFPADTDTVLETFSEIALDEPRTRLFDGTTEEGMLTFVTRSKAFGFPDFTTVKAVGEGDRTKLAVIGRMKWKGGSDFGVNGERLDRWLQEMRLRLGE